MDQGYYPQIGKEGGATMNSFLDMPEDRRRLVCEQTGAETGLFAASVEKDFWVSWTLKKLFNLPQWGEHLTFKGGTSLSKGWKLIERFSEDIDIVIDRSALGYDGDHDPASAPSKKQTRKRLDALKSAAQQCVKEEIHSLLNASLEESLPSDLEWTLELDAKDPDEQTILFGYPTVFPDHPQYLRQVVKIEMGARSDTDPAALVKIQPMIAEAFPAIFDQSLFKVRSVHPVRTFWEKAMLLHEETYRPSDKRHRKEGMARHYYDLYRLILNGIGKEAANDRHLFDKIVTHREIYFKYTWMDYSTIKPGSLRIIPLDDQISDWLSDYKGMQTEMFYGEIPKFEIILSTIRAFQNEYNNNHTKE